MNEKLGVWSLCDVASCRHESVRPARVDPREPLQRGARHRLVPRHPTLRHGLRRHPLRVGRADLRRGTQVPIQGVS